MGSLYVTKWFLVKARMSDGAPCRIEMNRAGDTLELHLTDVGETGD
jgi:hypothetical protein